MKKILLMAIIIVSATAAKAQQPSGVTDTTKQTMKLKDHVCTAACKNGQHMYAHGEKGHVCTAACTKMDAAGSMPLKEHVCTKKCKNGKHVYAHGEKGHVCTEACKKTSM